ncbi:hypothetical protein ABG067_001014 [Albugo candida]
MEFASFQFCVIMCGVQQPARSEYAPLLEKNRILRSFILFRWYKNLNIAIPKTKDDPVLPLQSRGRHGAWWELSHVFFTLLTSVVGAGMLSIPYTFTLITRWEALISLLVVGCSMGLMSIAILHANATLVANDTFTQNGSPNKYLSFHSIAVEAGGPLFGYIVSISIAIAIYGGCVGCIRIIRDIVPFVVSIILDPSNAAVETTLSESLLWFTFVLVVFPLCMLKSLSGLRFSSYVGFSFSVYLTLSIRCDMHTLVLAFGKLIRGIIWQQEGPRKHSAQSQKRSKDGTSSAGGLSHSRIIIPASFPPIARFV